MLQSQYKIIPLCFIKSSSMRISIKSIISTQRCQTSHLYIVDPCVLQFMGWRNTFTSIIVVQKNLHEREGSGLQPRMICWESLLNYKTLVLVLPPGRLSLAKFRFLSLMQIFWDLELCSIKYSTLRPNSVIVLE